MAAVTWTGPATAPARPSANDTVALFAKSSTVANLYSADAESTVEVVRRAAYQNAKAFCHKEFKRDKEAHSIWLSESSSMEDANRALQEAHKVFDEQNASRNRIKKATSSHWTAACLRLRQYAMVIDVLVSSHPEYAALAWGALRFLVLATTNHQELSTNVAKALVEIGEVLPEMDILTSLYPMPEVQVALAQLYAHLIEFFIRATSYFRTSRYRRRLMAITRSWAVEFQDILVEFRRQSERIRNLAHAASYTELRRVLVLTHEQRRSEVEISQVFREQGSIPPSLTPCIDIPFNYASIEGLLSHGGPDYLSALRTGTLMRDRRRKRNPEDFSAVWRSAYLKSWLSTRGPSVVVLKGSALRNTEARGIILDVIQLAQSINVPTSWFLTSTSQTSASFSVVDIIRSLMHQVLTQCPDAFKSSSINQETFRKCGTVTAWVGLFVSLVANIPGLLIVIEGSARIPQITATVKQFWQEILAAKVTTAIKIIVCSTTTDAEVKTLPSTTDHPSFEVNLNRNRRPGSSRLSVPSRRPKGSKGQGIEVLRPLMKPLSHTQRYQTGMTG